MGSEVLTKLGNHEPAGDGDKESKKEPFPPLQH